MKPKLRHCLVFVCVVFIFAFFCSPISVLAAGSKGRAVEAIPVSQNYSYDDYTVKQLSDGTWIRIGYDLIYDGTGEHVDRYHMEITDYSNVMGGSSLTFYNPSSIYVYANNGGYFSFSFYGITTATGSLEVYYVSFYY